MTQEKSFSEVALGVMWSYQPNLAEDPAVKKTCDLLQQTGEIYALTGKNEMGPYGTVMRSALEILNERTEALTGAPLRENFTNHIWECFNKTYPKPKAETIQPDVHQWRKTAAENKPTDRPKL